MGAKKASMSTWKMKRGTGGGGASKQQGSQQWFAGWSQESSVKPQGSVARACRGALLPARASWLNTEDPADLAGNRFGIGDGSARFRKSRRFVVSAEKDRFHGEPLAIQHG